MNRRGFLKSILAAGVAPYVVTTAGVLMPVRALAVPELRIMLRPERRYIRFVGRDGVTFVPTDWQEV